MYVSIRILDLHPSGATVQPKINDSKRENKNIKIIPNGNMLNYHHVQETHVGTVR